MKYEQFLADVGKTRDGVEGMGRTLSRVTSDEERKEIAQELRHYAVYGEGATLSEWWARLQSIATGEDDFPDPRSLFMRLAGLIDRAEVDDD